MKLVTLIRRRALAYELLAEYDADNQPFDAEAYARGCEAILSYASYRDTVGATRAAAELWRDSVTTPHGRSRRDGTRP